MTKLKVGLTIGAIVVGGGLLVVGLTSHRAPAHFTTVLASERPITQEVFATGTVKAPDTLALAVNASGRVVNIPVAIGAPVKQGDVLIALDGAGLALKVTQAQASRDNAKAKLDQLLAGAKPEDIALSRAAVDSARVNLIASQSSLEAALDQNDESKRNLAAAQLKATADLQNAYVTALAAGASANTTLGQARGDLNYIIRNQPLNFGVMDRDALPTLSETLSALDGPAAAASQALSRARTSRAPDDTTALLTAMVTALNSGVTTLEVMDAALLKTPFTISSALSANIALQSTIDSYRAKVAADITTVQSALTAVTATQTGISAAQAAGVAAVQNANVALATADSAVANASASAIASNAQLSQAQAQLTLKTAPPQAADIAALKAAVSQADADLAGAEQNLANATLLAPADGVITDIPLKLGELASPSTPAVNMITSGALKIEADIPEADILKIKVGQAASVTFDALAAATPYNATVKTIEPAQRLINNVVFFRATLLFDNPDNLIKPGMTANLTFTNTLKNAVPTVPQQALHQDPKTSAYYVEVLTPDAAAAAKTPVAIGARSSDGYTEITKGLGVGQRVVTEK